MCQPLISGPMVGDVTLGALTRTPRIRLMSYVVLLCS